MKIITIAGTVGKDGEIRSLQDGTKVLGFSVAVDDGYGQNKTTMWFDVSMFGKRAEVLEQYVTKGTKLTVSGELGKREHNGNTYLTVRASDIALQGGRSNDGGQSAGRSSRGGEKGDSYGSMGNAMSDEIPFAPEFR